MARVMGVDIGTTALKMAVYETQDGPDPLALVDQYAQSYSIHTYNNGLFSDIDSEKWKSAFISGCKALKAEIATVEAIGLSGTTPGLTALAADGTALYPSILMLDQRSRQQAARIIERIGMQALLENTGNMPVAGGCSLASILWLKDHEPQVFERTACFGHSNSAIALWLSGNTAIDPSSASLSGLYNTVRNDLSWNLEIAAEMGVAAAKLPPLLQSSQSPGRVKRDLSSQLGLDARPAVVIGGNDAVVAAYSLGIEKPGQVLNVNGTCEISLVCLPRCLPSTRYNVRAHVMPDRWLTLYVMNAGGKAYEWFQRLFCSEMPMQTFFDEFVPSAIAQWLDRSSSVEYVPYLMGSRYSQQPLTAAFHGMTDETTREELLAALVRGLCQYQREHLRDIALELPLAATTSVTGGAVNQAILQAKERWMRNSSYVMKEQSSMGGAALLALKHLSG